MDNLKILDNKEQQGLALIDSLELDSKVNATIVEFNHYLKLADLYHVEKKYTAESYILRRYISLPHCNRENFIEILDRIDRLDLLQKKLDNFPSFNTEKSLIGDDDNMDSIKSVIKTKPVINSRPVINSKPIVKPRHNLDKAAFIDKKLQVISISALYTGRDDFDEIFQLSLVLFEYNPKGDKKTRILETYVASIKPKKSIAQKKLNKMNFNSKIAEETIFDKNKIISLFERAGFAVSYNDADIERKLLSILIPEISTTPWYSCQKDIPWRALGYDNKSLSSLCLALNEKSPKNSLDRAKAICKILQKEEAGFSQVYLERLYNAHPMKPFEWTPQLIKQSQSLTKNNRYQISIVLIVLVIATASYGWFFN